MKLLTAAIRKAMPFGGAISNLENDKIPIICKFFLPEGRWTWYITDATLWTPDGTEKMLKDCTEEECEDEDNDIIFFGYCLSGLGEDCDELGTSSYQEMKKVRTRFGLPMERDLSFPIGKIMLSEVMGKTSIT